LKLAWDKSATVGNFTSGFRKCGIYPYNPDILADDVFEYEIVPAPNGADPVRLAEDIEDSPTPSSTATSFEELSPVPVIVSQSDGSVTKRKKQESAVLTSAAFKEKLRESKQKSRKQNRPIGIKKTVSRNSERRVGMDEPSFSGNLNHDENYCGVCSVLR
jgi:hypothetical protein